MTHIRAQRRDKKDKKKFINQGERNRGGKERHGRALNSPYGRRGRKRTRKKN